MDCPQCGKWNPDDKTQCWNCGAELPRPQPKKKKRQPTSSQTWVWIAVVVFLIFTLAQCWFMQQGTGGNQGGSLHHHLPIVYTLTTHFLSIG